ncbi:MAG TPA: AMP-binding protein [Rhizomicrobium sp.]|jgi:acyl-CoA synthetase (AMP-forming)/AMP-acid ligase II|nr:AMP-binding protein [Rhizomicrobium sp.]
MTTPLLSSNDLPAFHFINENGKARCLQPAAMAHRIRAVASYLKSVLPEGSVVGLLYKTEPNLVLNWLACVMAKLCPLVMQYPTRKQSGAYWSESVSNTVAVASVAAVVADGHCAKLGLRDIVRTITQSELDALGDAGAEPFSIDEFSIIQLSSGTTGFRKAIRFTGDQLQQHAVDYNLSLHISKDDRIVSWLPLYHDMGYIACFVMPMMLGVDVVMMDPMTWVRRPELLYDAIERYRGTICYMPNFGFEVMARTGGRRLPSMRWWVSCSEPISAETSRKFLEAIDARLESFGACYAMAENVFAVSIHRGIKTTDVDGVPVVSCGKPIADVDVKIVEDEVLVRSRTSLTSYIGGEDIRDGEGYYPTGDLGRLIGGELFITGRKQDLLVQAGRKYMLSDIDLVLNRCYPDVRGRAAAMPIYDLRLGTQKPVVLIEALDFFLRSDQSEMAEKLKSIVGLDRIDVHFVPPRFLTKTSSGKFNRKKCTADWLLFEKARQCKRPVASNPLAELRESFSNVPWNEPVEQVLDSLSLTVLRIILSDTQVRYNEKLTIRAIEQALDQHHQDLESDQSVREVIHIVSLADRRVMQDLSESHIEKLSTCLGVPVSLTHVCLPPSPIILSDLIFHDYFEPRLPPDAFIGIDRAFAKLRQASMIIVDDRAEMFFPPRQVYGVLSHNLERDEQADLVSVRWQRYAQFHDRLPLTVVSGADLSLEDRTNVLDMLSMYLGIPIFRIAEIQGYDRFTREWDHRPLTAATAGLGGHSPADPDILISALGRWLENLGDKVKPVRTSANIKLETSDLGHYCSAYIKKDKVDRLLAKYESFCIAGQSSSIPYIRRELDRQRKAYYCVQSYAPDILAKLAGSFDCLLICGAMGKFPVSGPAAAIMSRGHGWQTQNIDDPELSGCQFTEDSYPATREDWFYPFQKDRIRSANEERLVNSATAAGIQRFLHEHEAKLEKQAAKRAELLAAQTARRAELQAAKRAELLATQAARRADFQAAKRAELLAAKALRLQQREAGLAKKAEQLRKRERESTPWPQDESGPEINGADATPGSAAE